MKHITIEQRLKAALTAVDDARQRAYDLGDDFALAEHALLSTVLYDLASYFGENGINSFQKDRLIQMGFKP
jgi:hypothetical protein